MLDLTRDEARRLLAGLQKRRAAAIDAGDVDAMASFDDRIAEVEKRLSAFTPARPTGPVAKGTPAVPRARVFVVVAVLLSFGMLWATCDDAGTETAVTETTEPDTLMAEERAERVRSVFDDPARVCSALAHEGLPPLPRTNWTNVDGAGFHCGTDSVEITPGGYNFVGDVPNTVTYYAEAASPETVDWVRLTGNVFNERHEAPVVSRMSELARALFAGLGLEPHEGALAALAEQRTAEFTTDYGQIRVERDDSYNLGHGVRLVIDGR